MKQESNLAQAKPVMLKVNWRLREDLRKRAGHVLADHPKVTLQDLYNDAVEAHLDRLERKKGRLAS
jgi:hypothetical protein